MYNVVLDADLNAAINILNLAVAGGTTLPARRGGSEGYAG